MWNDKRAIELLEIEHPVIQAPMAGPSNPQLVAAVCEAGGLGGLSAAGKSPDDLREAIREIRSLTDRPFNVNLFNRSTEVYDTEARLGPRLNELLQSYHSAMGLGPVPDPFPLFGPADKQLEVLIEERVPVVSFHYGVDGTTVAAAKEAGAKVLCSATTVSESILLEELGVDAVVAQGAEAGGHRGTFQGDYRQALVGTVALVPRVADAVSVPIIAAGGIMDSRGFVACLALGASAVQMGTAFLGCPEATVAPVWRNALERAEAESTVVTEVISGKPARCLHNHYIEEMEAINEPLLPYPAQLAVSRELRNEAVRRGEESFVALYAGQGVGLFRLQSATELVKHLVADSQQLVNRLARG